MQTAGHLGKRGEKNRRKHKEEGIRLGQRGQKKGQKEVTRGQESLLPKAVTNNMHTHCLVLSISASSEDTL